jgi:hypothetical protein
LYGTACDQFDQKGQCRDPVGLFDKLCEDKFACPINGNEQMQLALFGAHFGNADVKKADWIRLELLLGLFVALDLRQTADFVTLV